MANLCECSLRWHWHEGTQSFTIRQSFGAISSMYTSNLSQGAWHLSSRIGWFTVFRAPPLPFSTPEMLRFPAIVPHIRNNGKISCKIFFNLLLIWVRIFTKQCQCIHNKTRVTNPHCSAPWSAMKPPNSAASLLSPSRVVTDFLSSSCQNRAGQHGEAHLPKNTVHNPQLEVSHPRFTL